MGHQLVNRICSKLWASLTILVIIPASLALASSGAASGKASKEGGKPAAGQPAVSGTTGAPRAQSTLPPMISASFGPIGIQPNGTSTLTVTITNPNASTTLTGLAFTDSLPANVVVANPNGLTSTCPSGTVTATAGSGSISYSGGTVAGGSSCMIMVNVTSAFTGSYLDSTGPVSSTNGGTGNTATATLNVANPPTISKLFLPTSITQNEATLLSFTIENPNSDSTSPNSDVTLTGLSFTDSLPAGLVVATPNGASNSCGGTLTATPGSSVITLTGGSLGPQAPLIAPGKNKRLPGHFDSEKPEDTPPASGDCFVSVSVVPTTQTTLNNTTGAISANESGQGTTSNTATLTVTAPPVPLEATKVFSSSTVALGGTSTLTFTINNPNPSTMFVDAGITDTLPSGLVVANPNGATGTCISSDSGSVTAVPGGHSITIGQISLGGMSSCTASVNVIGSAAGEQNNVTGDVTGSFDPGSGIPVPLAGTTASASITVVAPPTISKAFANPGVPTGGTTALTFTLTNPNTSTALNGVQFSDTFPAGLVVATPLSTSDTCGGTFNATAGGSSVSLTGGTISAGTNCTISVAVEPTTSGVKTNITGAVSSTNGGTGTTSNTATTFSFNECIKDDTTGDTLQWSTSTGTYIFTNCKTGLTVSGTGTTSFVNGAETLTDSEKTQKVTASFNTGSLTGHAVITLISSSGVSQTFTINQTKTHVTCSCSVD